MSINSMIKKLRTGANMSQEQFADLFGVSRQSVQKWESGVSMPELDKIIKICKYFDISLDALIFDGSARVTDELKFTKELKPKYENIHSWEAYSANLSIEYKQSIEEGLDIKAYSDIFTAVSRLEQNETKKRLADVLFDVVLNAKKIELYKYIEPSELDEIKNLREGNTHLPPLNKNLLKSKITGAWFGRICGCMLGKTVEGIMTDELIPFLKETNNYPMHRYILHSDLNEDILNKYQYRFASRFYADKIDGMPVDDDTNYVVLAQLLIERYGRNFTSYDVAQTWLSQQSKNEYCTAERVAFCNFVKGYEPPQSAVYKNPFREWIGAQIRGDYFGYINPGDPELAAEMAFRDASISHVKNGIYGEMFVAAMLAAAACTKNMSVIIKCGIEQIPHTSRLYEAIKQVLSEFDKGTPQNVCFEHIHAKFDEHFCHDWCHTISNAMIVAAALLYGNGSFGKSICMAVEAGFDTDCNGATVGSIVGMANGIDCIDKSWTDPIQNVLHSSVFDVGSSLVTDRIEQTLKHIER